MASKMDESTPGVKVLRIFRRLLVDRGKHYQAELAKEFNCSPQTIIRVMLDIENVIGVNLETGLDNRKRWYRLKGKLGMNVGKDSEEVRYLSICRDIAAPTMSRDSLSRMDDAIFQISLQFSEEAGAPGKVPQIRFFSKGMVDYRPYMGIIEKISQAIDRRRVCEIEYKAAGSKLVKKYFFAPSSFLSMSQTLYVAGAILEDNKVDVRHYCTLPAQRIKSCVITERRHNAEFPEIDSDSFGLPWHEPKWYRIVFRAGRAADYVAERIWSGKQKIDYKPNGDLSLELLTTSEPELDSWVRSFGDEVLEYGEIVEEKAEEDA
ncbi:MAG: WYL domain-containing protein [Desulfovibrio sp.]|nr:WYL domain-containing protein [Desulfovibrio sp.]